MMSSNKVKTQVYLLRIITNKAIVYKIGVSHNVKKRISALSNPEKPSSQVKGKGIKVLQIELLGVLYFDTSEESYACERVLLKRNKKIKYYGQPLIPNGNTELFKSKPFFGNNYDPT